MYELKGTASAIPVDHKLIVSSTRQNEGCGGGKAASLRNSAIPVKSTPKVLAVIDDARISHALSLCHKGVEVRGVPLSNRGAGLQAASAFPRWASSSRGLQDLNHLTRLVPNRKAPWTLLRLWPNTLDNTAGCLMCFGPKLAKTNTTQ